VGLLAAQSGQQLLLDPAHPQCAGAGQTPYHTIIPGIITRADGSLYGPFGVMGGFNQPQGHMQVVVGLVDDGLEPQAALDRPRFCLDPVIKMAAKSTWKLASRPRWWRPSLRAATRCRPIVAGFDRALFGRGQIIRREPDGVLWGGSDPRADGCALGW